MFKKALLSAAIVGMGSVSLVANANESYNGYLFGAVGQADHKISSSTRNDLDASINSFSGVTVSRSSLDTKDTAWKVGAGIRAHENVAFEFQYIDLGEARYKADTNLGRLTAPVETRGLGANAVFILPLDSVELFAKVGYHQMRSKVRASIGGVSSSDSEKKWRTGMGLGAAFSLNQDFALTGEFERYRNIAGDYNVDMWSVGLRYKF